MNILYIGSAFLILFFVFLLWSKPSKNIADVILSGWFLLIFLSICTAYIVHQNLSGWNWLLELTDAAAILHGVFAFFYTKALTTKQFEWNRRVLLHLIPFVAALIFVYHPYLNGQQISGAERNGLMVIKFIIAAIYLMASLRLLQQYREKIGDLFSHPSDTLELNWLRLLIWSFLIILFISVFSQIIHHFTSFQIAQFGGFYTNLLIVLLVFLIGYFGFRQTMIFAPEHLLVDLPGEIMAPAQKEKAPPPAPTKSYQLLLDFMRAHKPYLEPELTLYRLANQLSLPAYQLSQYINQYSGSNFFDFVNQYRTEEVKRRIKAGEAQHKTLLAIALDSGFNSKAAFNRAFKKFTGVTPSDYRKMYGSEN